MQFPMSSTVAVEFWRQSTGDSIDDIGRVRCLKLVEKVFERYIVLGRSAGIGTVESIFDERGNELYIGSLSVAN